MATREEGLALSIAEHMCAVDLTSVRFILVQREKDQNAHFLLVDAQNRQSVE